jgi:hypothetical protein
MYYKGVQPFYALEYMHLHSVIISVQFNKVMALCPRLHTLSLPETQPLPRAHFCSES